MDPISGKTLTDSLPPKRQRRRHSSVFKAEVLAACAEPGASVASVAQRYHVNANLAHKWRRVAEASEPSVESEPGFLPVTMPVSAAPDIRVTLIDGDVTLHWPISHIQQVLPWIKSLQA